MGLVDFWDNITTPGFIAHSFTELQQLGKEITEEAKELVEEGQEIFSFEAFNEIVLLGKDYKSSAEMRLAGKEQIENAHKTTLESRGIISSIQRVLNVINYEFKNISEELKTSPEGEVQECHLLFLAQFNYLKFPLQALPYAQLIEKVDELLKLPKPPTYNAPERNADSVTVGPVSIEISDKKQRRTAAEQYLEEVNEYEESCKTVECDIHVDSSVLTEDIANLLLQFSDYYWQLRILPDEEKIKGLVLLRAAIYTPVEDALSDEDDTKNHVTGLLDELVMVNEQIQNLVGKSL